MLSTYPDRGGKPSVGDAIWIDLLNPSDDEMNAVAAELGVSIPTRAQLEEIESSSRLHIADGRLHLSVPLSAQSVDAETTPLGFILAPKFLVTIRFTERHAFDAAAQAFKTSAPGSAEVFATLLEGMVDFGADMLEQIAAELNGVSKGVFRHYGNTRQH